MRSLPIASNGAWDVTPRTSLWFASNGFGPGDFNSSHTTSSQQDFIWTETRLEDNTIIYTRKGGSVSWHTIAQNHSAGQIFTAIKYFDRLRILINGDNGRIVLGLYDSPLKNTVYNLSFFSEVADNSYIEVSFDALPSGSYYWELIMSSKNMNIKKGTGGLYDGGYAYIDGVEQSNTYFDSKIYNCQSELSIVLISVEGDDINSGRDTIDTCNNICFIDLDEDNIKDIARVGDNTTNDGIISTGVWYLQSEDE